MRKILFSAPFLLAWSQPELEERLKIQHEQMVREQQMQMQQDQIRIEQEQERFQEQMRQQQMEMQNNCCK